MNGNRQDSETPPPIIEEERRKGPPSSPIAFLVVLIVVAATGICLGPSQLAQRQKRSEESPELVLKRLIAADAERVAAGDSTHFELVRFYQGRRLQPAWLKGGKPNARARTFIEVLNHAPDHGLDPEDYGTAGLDSALHTLAAGPDTSIDRGWFGASLDRRLTNTYFKYAEDRLGGRFVPEKLTSSWMGARRRVLSLADNLGGAIRNGHLADSLDALDPMRPEYRELEHALARYRAIARAGGWPVVPGGDVLHVGLRSSRVPTLRRRLAASGDLVGSGKARADTTSERFDQALVAAVKTFQIRNGLRADGRVGAPELKALNIPVEDRIERLAINLERWRWSPENFGERHVIVNLPEFMLQIVVRDTLQEAIPVVIGQDTTRTPVFDDLITYIVFGPTWRVPQSILRNELLPALKRDKHYLEKMFMRVYDGTKTDAVELRADSIPWKKLDPESLKVWVRQEPGPENPLGRVKFMLPNKWDVYLHDSPARGPFTRVDRRASHGCVRVERPFDFAMWLLQDKSPKWDSLMVRTAMDTSHDHVIGLPKAFPVHFVYRTAWVDSMARVHFRSDVYGYDTLHARAVGHPLERIGRERRPQGDQ